MLYEVITLNPGPLTYRMADAAIRLKLSHSRASYPAPVTPAPPSATPTSTRTPVVATSTQELRATLRNNFV